MPNLDRWHRPQEQEAGFSIKKLTRSEPYTLMRNRRKLQHNTPGENELIEVLSYTNGIAGPKSWLSWLGMQIAQRGDVARSLNST